jgi:hypothetical protein
VTGPAGHAPGVVIEVFKNYGLDVAGLSEKGYRGFSDRMIGDIQRFLCVES